MRYSGFLNAVHRGLGCDVLDRPNAPAQSSAAFDWLIAQGLTPATRRHRRRMTPAAQGLTPATPATPATPGSDTRDPAIHRRYRSGVRFRAGWPGSASFARSEGRIVHSLAGPSHFRLKRAGRGERSAG